MSSVVLSDHVQRLMALFAGNTSAHGTHGKAIANGNGAKVEIKSTARTLKEPVTAELWRQHIDGTRPLGIISIRKDGTCLWGAIDVDDYNTNHAELVEKIGRLRLPLHVFRSKSNGAHLFLLLREPQLAAAVRACLNKMARTLGLEGCEIFPKQETLAEGQVGNWLNMPYCGGERAAIKRGGLEMTLPEFLELAEERQLSSEQFAELTGPSLRAARDSPHDGAPPCIQAMLASGVQEHVGRNSALFQLGVYAQKRWPGDWEHRLEEFNQEVMRPPLVAEELVGIKKSLRKKDYGYKCADQPMCDLCDRPTCLMRQWGVGGGAAHPVITSWRKVMSDEPTWYVKLADCDSELVITDIRDLTSPRRFVDKCAEQLGRFFSLMKQEKWAAVLQEKESELVVEEAPLDLTPEGRFRQVLEEFLTDRMRGKSRDDLLRGAPWEDEEAGRYYFRMRDLERAVRRDGRLPNVLPHHYERWMKKLGGGALGPRTIKGTSVRLWWVPSSALGRPEPLDVPPPSPGGASERETSATTTACCPEAGERSRESAAETYIIRARLR